MDLLGWKAKQHKGRVGKLLRFGPVRSWNLRFRFPDNEQVGWGINSNKDVKNF